MPWSGAMRTIGRIASTPWTWPAMLGSPFAAAQRRFPSMMMATWRAPWLGGDGRQTSITSASLRSVRSSMATM